MSASVSMRSEEVSECERLDRVFDHTLADMKQHVLQLPLKTDRQRCALWIKKLCEPPSPPLAGRKLRNSYTELMLKTLQKGGLGSVFIQRPTTGPLEPLSSQMLSSLESSKASQDVHNLPSWVNSDLLESSRLITTTALSSPQRHQSTLDTSKNTTGWTTDGTDTSTVPDFRQRLGLPLRRRSHTSLGLPTSVHLRSPRSGKISPNHSFTTADDIDIGTNRALPHHAVTFLPPHHPTQTKWDHGDTLASTTFNTDAGSTVSDYVAKSDKRELEMKLKVMEAKYQEERLVLQQKHDTEVQKVLNRKNVELDEMRAHYTQKVKDADAYVNKLEHQMQHVQSEHEGVSSAKDQKYTQLKALLDKTEDGARKKYDEKLHDAIADFEQEKYEMQKLHTKNISEILEDTNGRLQKMETQYAQQIQSTTSMISELETRVHQVMNESSAIATAKVALEKDITDVRLNRDELQRQLLVTNEQLDSLQARYKKCEQEHIQAVETHKCVIKDMREKSESVADYMQTEYNAQLAAANEKMGAQKTLIDTLKLSLKEADEQRIKQLKINTLNKEVGLKLQEVQNDNKKLAQQIKEKDAEITSLQEQKAQIREQSDAALADFKGQVEKNQARIYDDMKLNMAKIEGDLDKSRQMREKQTKEFTKQLAEERQRHDNELREQREGFNQERAKILQENDLERKKQKLATDGDVETLRGAHEQKLSQVTSHAKHKEERLNRTIVQLEEKVAQLREELLQSNQTRKQQLVELGLARDEEKQNILRQHEAQLNKIQSAMDQQNMSLRQTHAQELDTQLQETNSRFKDMENEFTDKAQKHTDTIQKLQFSVQDLHNQIKKQKDLGDKNVIELRLRYDDEKKVLHKKYSHSITTLKQDLDSQRSLIKSTQNKLQQQCVEQAEQATKLKLENQEKLHGLLPSAIQKDYEDTIASLKSQIDTLQQTVVLLNDELSSRQISPHKSSKHKSPSKTNVKEINRTAKMTL